MIKPQYDPDRDYAGTDDPYVRAKNDINRPKITTNNDGTPSAIDIPVITESDELNRRLKEAAHNWAFWL